MKFPFPRLSRRKFTLLLPLLVILTWLAVSAVGGPYFGRINEVSSNDLATFLPKSAESTKVNDELAKFRSTRTIPAIVVFAGNAPLNDSQRQQISTAQSALQKSGEVKGSVVPPIYAKDGKAALLIIPLDSNSEFEKTVPKLQTAVNDTRPTLEYKFTGPAMFARDLNKAFAGIDGTLLLVALVVVFLILLIVYRSPFLPVITLLGAIFALSSAILVVWHLAQYDILQLNGQVQGILFILVIGATTDYSLLYIARYREELTHHESKWQATKAAWKAAYEPIIAAGGTVTLGLLCLLVSDLGSNKALGPVGGLGIIFAILAALSFLPATLLLLGRTAFWPRHPAYVPDKSLTDYHAQHPAWARVGTLVSRYPRRLWAVLVVLLLIACIFIPQFKAQGVSQSDLIIGKSEARDGQKLLDAHFPGGSGSPAYVLVPQQAQDAVLAKLEADKGVSSVSIDTTNPAKNPAPRGQLEQQIKQEIRQGVLAQQPALQANPAALDALVASAYPFADTTPKVIDGQVLYEAVLKDPADSVAARETIMRLRQAIHPENPQVKIGGGSALQLDTNTASKRDLRIIIPLILAAITIVLMLLLRAVVAPLVLLFTTVLSFGATLGIAALLFNHLWHFSGADPAVVIFSFVFLVALGIDYNIFLMTRVREETIKLGVRTGTLKALVVTGGVITSAGIVLAATFAALYVIPILFLAQIAFIVAFGVLLDTFIVRSLIVPGITLTIGRKMWWPSALARTGKE